MREEVTEHDFGGNPGGEAVAAAHAAKAVPLAQLGGEGVQVGGPVGSFLLGQGIGGEVEAGVQGGREAGEGRALLVDAGLDEVTGRAG